MLKNFKTQGLYSFVLYVKQFDTVISRKTAKISTIRPLENTNLEGNYQNKGLVL